jgi:hypothetical protein
MIFFKRETVSALTIAAALFLQTDAAQACACCTEPGQRFELSGPMDTYVRGELALMRFAPTAALFSGPGFPDDILGVVNPSSDPYRVRAAIRGAVSFEIVDAAGKTGRIQFALPRALSRFEVDPRSDLGPAPPNGPSLYKEWRLSGPARLSGVAAGAGSFATATLILHGGGNSCSSAIDFKRWTLSVKGKGIEFTFLGDLIS